MFGFRCITERRILGVLLGSKVKQILEIYLSAKKQFNVCAVVGRGDRFLFEEI